ncbi:MAG TPA: tannase/feruloyl esterase family alpha/beta hydrolase [Thermoanaerobaculia bacterium]|nr:tannase/feruloyl esterase family alpha/beta hydrolase [Thermoanaerobaculia bacterium]
MTIPLAVLLWMAPSSTRCGTLTHLTLANTTIANAHIVAAGAFHLPPDGRNAAPEFFTAFDRLPAFCRVQATIMPSAGSHIEVEVWLPESRWNGEYLGVGNGGFGGSFNYYRLGEALNNGYATASTDTGHKGATSDSQWSVGHPEKQIDFDYRAIHEMTAMAKAAIRSFYGRPPGHSYFNGCSNGGRQGLMEAQHYPADYDGIMAGAPAIHWGFNAFVSDDLEAFRDRGGKLVIYHGGADRPESSIHYYRQLVSRMGQKAVRGFVQLYVVPGMGHCGSGPVPNDFGQWVRPDAEPKHSMLKALERWVEEGVPPKSVIATQYNTDGVPMSGVLRTRPLCPYPEEECGKR